MAITIFSPVGQDAFQFVMGLDEGAYLNAS